MSRREAAEVPFVSIIVPVYRSDPATLTEVLEALARVDHPPGRREILVVDNDLAGGRELEPLVLRFAPGARYLRSPSAGAAAARNYGLLRASGDYCLFVDDDVLVDAGCVGALLAAFTDGTVGAAGGKIRPLWRDCTPPAWLDLFLDATYVERDHYREVLQAAAASVAEPRLNLGLLSLLDLGDAPMDVDDGWLYSCHLIVRRTVAIEAGGFDPDLLGRHALGDNEMGLLRRIAAMGLRLRYEPKAIVTHIVRRSRLTMRYLARRTFQDGECDAYIQLREGRVHGRVSAMRESLTRLAAAAVALAGAAARAAVRNTGWRLALARACTHYGAARYYLTYTCSPGRRQLVHQANYLDALPQSG